MSPRKTLAAALATALIAAPAASAMPIDPTGSAQDPRQQDMHASTVQKPESGSDLRGESAASGGTAVAPNKTDLRGESAATGGTGSGTKDGPVFQPAPTWPAYPTPLPLPRTAPAPVTVDGDDEFPVELLIIGGLAALVAGMGAVAMRGRARPAL